MSRDLDRMAGERRVTFNAILVTLAALAAYRLLLAVPLPGLNLDSVRNDNVQVLSLATYSIASVGLMAWLSAALLAELVVLLLPTSWTVRFATNGHADPFLPLILAGALFLTALQGYGVVAAMEAVPGLVVEPGTVFRGVAVTSLLGGTALVVSLARLIDARGVGMGFWVMLGASFVSGMAHDLIILVQQALVTGFIQLPLNLGVGLAVVLGGTAAVVAILLARRNMAMPRMEPVMWPVVLAVMIYPWVVVAIAIAVSLVSSQDDPELDLWLLNGPVGILAFAAITFGLAVRYARREGQPGVSLATAGLLTAVVIATMVPIAWAIVIPVAAGQLVVIAVCATMVCRAIWQEPSA